jgi:hypothetical protein
MVGGVEEEPRARVNLAVATACPEDGRRRLVPTGAQLWMEADNNLCFG